VVVKYDRFASESRHHDKNTRCVAESAHKNPGDWSFLLSYLQQAGLIDSGIERS
jgi:hypothetical protein